MATESADAKKSLLTSLERRDAYNALRVIERVMAGRSIEEQAKIRGEMDDMRSLVRSVFAPIEFNVTKLKQKRIFEFGGASVILERENGENRAREHVVIRVLGQGNLPLGGISLNISGNNGRSQESTFLDGEGIAKIPILDPNETIRISFGAQWKTD